MLIELHRQLRRLLRGRQARCSWALLAALWLTANVASANALSMEHFAIGAAHDAHPIASATQQGESCHQHLADSADAALADRDDHTSCHCAQPCHGGAIAIVASALAPAAATTATAPPEQTLARLTALPARHYRPPISPAV